MLLWSLVLACGLVGSAGLATADEAIDWRGVPEDEAAYLARLLEVAGEDLRERDAWIEAVARDGGRGVPHEPPARLASFLDANEPPEGLEDVADDLEDALEEHADALEEWAEEARETGWASRSVLAESRGANRASRTLHQIADRLRRIYSAAPAETLDRIERTLCGLDLM